MAKIALIKSDFDSAKMLAKKRELSRPTLMREMANSRLISTAFGR